MSDSIWPLGNLQVEGERLTLRPVTDSDLLDLAKLVPSIHSPDEMPFNYAWTRGESPVVEREAMQYHWKKRSEISPAEWDLSFTVRFGDVNVGIQTLSATEFAISKSVQTGSWLGGEWQGRGFGKEMRAAVLWFAFEVLGALDATTEAWEWNAKSVGVTHKMGYLDNGYTFKAVDGKRMKELRFRLDRARWYELTKPLYQFDVICSDDCLSLLGAKEA